MNSSNNTVKVSRTVFLNQSERREQEMSFEKRMATHHLQNNMHNPWPIRTRPVQVGAVALLGLRGAGPEQPFAYKPRNTIVTHAVAVTTCSKHTYLTTRRQKHAFKVEQSTNSLCVSDSVWQAVNIWRLKVYSYGRLLFFAMCRSIMHAPVIRARL